MIALSSSRHHPLLAQAAATLKESAELSQLRAALHRANAEIQRLRSEAIHRAHRLDRLERVTLHVCDNTTAFRRHYHAARYWQQPSPRVVITSETIQVR